MLPNRDLSFRSDDPGRGESQRCDPRSRRPRHDEAHLINTSAGVADCRGGEIKETVIGVEVFRRRPDYDPRSDPVVRMEAAKLRARLAEHYSGPGAGDPIRIEIPKGGYVPRWQIARTPALSMRLIAAIALGALLTAVPVVWRASRPGGKPTIAVLPFVNFSPDAGDEYFSDGLTEEITQALSVVEGLDVT